MGVSIFNTGYDLQDQIDAAESAIAIVSIGNTHAAITSGQYVYVREHGTLAEGLYRATANVAADGTLSGSNVTAVSGGGLNALNSNVNYVRNRVEIGDVSTESALSTALNTIVSSMSNYEVRNGQFRFTGTSTDNFTNGVRYGITISRGASADYCGATIIGLGYEVTVEAAKSTSGWTYAKLALNSNLNSLTSISDVKSQLTSATGITINSMIKQEIGRLVIAYMMITTSSVISANTEIVSGMPIPYGTQNYVTTFLAHTAITTELDTYRFSLLDGGKIVNLDELPNGKIIRATFTYFKN